MRIVTVAALAGLAIIGLAACGKNNGAATSAQPAASPGLSLPSSGPPHRKPGLWEQSMTSGRAGGAAMPVVQMCVDDASEQKTSLFSAQIRKTCQNTAQIKHNFDGTWSTSASCDMHEAGVITTNATITGDFNSSYVVNVDSVTTGSASPAANGEHKMTMQGRWVGPCPAGWVGGDMMVNGMKMNILGGAAAGGGSTGVGGG